MNGKTIATTYFYLISTASVALIVIGIFNGINYTINKTQFAKYPPRWGGLPLDCESRYKYGPYPVDITVPVPTPDPERELREKELCEKQQNQEAKQHEIDDIKNTLSFTVIGSLLFLIHFPLARKSSK